MSDSNSPSRGGVLVTGGAGFVGKHALLRLPQAIPLNSVKGDAINILDQDALRRYFSTHLPDSVLHLAGQSFVPESFRDPEATYAANFTGTLRLLTALAENGFKGRFVYVSSGDAYGLVTPQDLPIHEHLPLRPRNPYAVSKAAAEALCFQWSQTGPFEVVVARPFNHIGAGQSPSFAISDFARQIAEIKAGKRQAVLNVGNIEATRDFTDVGDVIAAYALLLRFGHNGEIYNICSGIERSVRSLLDRLLELTCVNADIVIDPLRSRPSEQPRVWGSHEKLSQHTGWQPGVSLDDSLLSLYSYWKEEIEK